MHNIISQARLKRVLTLAWAVLVFAGFGVEYWKYILDGERTNLVYFLGLGYEGNLPTWYSSTLLLLCSLQLALIATGQTERQTPFAKHWWILAAGFLYMSMDETAQVHENAGKWFDFSGVLFYGWVIPASILVLLIGVSYMRFLAHLPRRVRYQFILSGAIYVGGAVGLDFALGWWVDRAGTKNFTYGLIDWVEESMEIMGTSLFLCSLTEYSRREKGLEVDSAARIAAAGTCQRHAAVALAHVDCREARAVETENAELAEVCEL